jgi:hypothetical protein
MRPDDGPVQWSRFTPFIGRPGGLLVPERAFLPSLRDGQPFDQAAFFAPRRPVWGVIAGGFRGRYRIVFLCRIGA